MNINILIAEDDILFRKLIKDILANEGYSVFLASDGEEAIDIFYEASKIDLIILDVMMPKCNGYEVVEEIRKSSDVPIIMLTALSDESHEIKGFKYGADEYIGKPFSLEVFKARVESKLRKVKKEKEKEFKFDNFYINGVSRVVTINNSEVDLNNKEFNLLFYLINNINMVLTREQIINAVWGYDFDGDFRTVDTHIKTLRAKLKDYGNYIKTLRGTGYSFKEDINEKY